jgi:hypothetical protein
VPQFVHHLHVGLVRRRRDQHMHQTRVGIHTSVRLHSEAPRVAFLRLVPLIVQNQRLADTIRTLSSILSRQEAELRRFEAESPGITKLQRAVDGSIVLEDDDEP